MASDNYIQVAYIRGQLRTAHEAIAAIWHAHHAATVLGVTDYAEVADAIERATAHIDPEFRSPEMPSIKPKSAKKPVDEIEDLLG